MQTPQKYIKLTNTIKIWACCGALKERGNLKRSAIMPEQNDNDKSSIINTKKNGAAKLIEKAQGNPK